MKFGKPNRQKYAERQVEIARMADGIVRFAYLPVKLKNGEWIWLQKYKAKYIVAKFPDGELYLLSSARDDFSPMADYYEINED